MTNEDHKIIMSSAEFAHLGDGEIAYMKKTNSDDLAQSFPALPPLAPGLELWALFSASGEPILVSDSAAQALAGAQEQELDTVTLH
jgi:hypothetical protein